MKTYTETELAEYHKNEACKKYFVGISILISIAATTALYFYNIVDDMIPLFGIGLLTTLLIYNIITPSLATSPDDENVAVNSLEPQYKLQRLGLAIFVHAILASIGLIFIHWISSSGAFHMIMISAGAGLLSYSLFDTFEMIPLYHKGIIVYFGKAIYQDIASGLTCLGLPHWLGAYIDMIDCHSRTVTLGLLQVNRLVLVAHRGRGHSQ